MSATPEQIAERLEMQAAAVESTYGAIAGPTAKEFRAAAALMRAQAERVRVLEDAASRLMTLVEPMVRGNTDFSVTWRKYVREMRAALHGEA